MLEKSTELQVNMILFRDQK